MPAVSPRKPTPAAAQPLYGPPLHLEEVSSNIMGACGQFSWQECGVQQLAASSHWKGLRVHTTGLCLLCGSKGSTTCRGLQAHPLAHSTDTLSCTYALIVESSWLPSFDHDGSYGLQPGAWYLRQSSHVTQEQHQMQQSMLEPSWVHTKHRGDHQDTQCPNTTQMVMAMRMFTLSTTKHQHGMTQL